MKEYRYKINGNLYKVTVGDIEDNNVRVEVNGTPYTVELEKQNKPKIKPVVRTASTTPAAPPAAHCGGGHHGDGRDKRRQKNRRDRYRFHCAGQRYLRHRPRAEGRRPYRQYHPL